MADFLPWNAVSILGAILVLVGFLLKGMQMSLEGPSFLVAFWTRLRTTNTLDLPRFMIRRTLATLGWLSQFLNFVSSIATLIAIFILVRIVRYIFEINHRGDDFSVVADSVKHLRDGILYLFLFLLAVGIVRYLIVAATSDDERKTRNAEGIDQAMQLIIFGAAAYQTYLVAGFVLTSYGKILSSSLSGSPIEALWSQALLVPLNSIAFGVPAVLLSWVLVTQFEEPLRRALLTDAEQAALNAETHRASARSSYQVRNLLVGRLGLNAGVTASFILTALALYIGSVFVPSETIHLTPQLFLTNVACDGLTLFGTVVLLGFAATGNSAIRLLFVIVIDLSFAALLAVTSLFIGLYGTEQAVTLKEAAFILIGGHHTGSDGFYLGQMFWAMHTAFIPTVLFWFIILISIIGKVLLWFVGNIFGLHEKNWTLEIWGGTIFSIGGAWTVLQPHAFSWWHLAHDWIQTAL